MSLAKYLDKFSDLRPNRSGGRSSPHKACLLLAVIDLIEAGELVENRIVFGQELKNAFSRRFEKYCRDNDRDNPSNPYFYLTSSGFWHLRPAPGGDAELQRRLDERKAPTAAAMARLVDYAWLDSDLYHLLRDAGCRSILAGKLEGTLLSNEEAFSAWCRQIGKSEKTTKNYVGALGGSLSQWISDCREQRIALLDVKDPNQLLGVQEELATYSFYLERDRVGKGMYSAAMRLYGRFLQEVSPYSRAEGDIEELHLRQLEPTVRETLVNARRGQGLFRNRVLDFWGSRCAVTGYGNVRFLLASHIKPWKSSSDQERLDGFNGFPLIPGLDRAFDMGYISFQSNGEILISNELEEPCTLGVFEYQSISLDRRHQAYLEFHRSELFLG